MNCQYCQKYIEMHADATLLPTTPWNSRFWVGECKDCHAVYHCRKKPAEELGPPHCIIWNDIFLEEEEYRIRMYPYSNLFEVLHVIPDTLHSVNETVHLFRFIPNWTPQNVKEKLIAYLPFL